MANLYGTVKGDRVKIKASRFADRQLVVTAETWAVIAEITLSKDGEMFILLWDKKHEKHFTLWHGNLESFAREWEWESLRPALPREGIERD